MAFDFEIAAAEFALRNATWQIFIKGLSIGKLSFLKSYLVIGFSGDRK